MQAEEIRATKMKKALVNSIFHFYYELSGPRRAAVCSSKQFPLQKESKQISKTAIPNAEDSH
jgi:hypothetical protein